ncbi:MAG: threonine-phosphate decarboxylase CobD [Parvibaculaceae bacterium]|nr:threonine-phosphate decarboxylase CobD [Parvibaculaceae bacterium]
MAKTNSIAHGGDLGAIVQVYRDAPTPWIDLSTGINPWSYPHATPPLDLNALPSNAEAHACRVSMAQYLACPPETISLMPGSQISISLLPHLLPRSRVVIAGPTYEEHALSWRNSGHDVTVLPLPEACTEPADILVVVHPNNPDGKLITVEELERLRRRQAAHGGWLIVDEAFGDICPAESFASHAGADGLIVLRSFGKFFGMAGLRLGAVLCPPALQQKLQQAIGPWAVSTHALRIGAQAYQDTAWISQMRNRLTSCAEELATVLRLAGLEIIGGTDLFCLAQHPNAQNIFIQLAKAGIYVRHFDTYPTWLRFGLPGKAIDLARLRHALPAPSSRSSNQGDI